MAIINKLLKPISQTELIIPQTSATENAPVPTATLVQNSIANNTQVSTAGNLAMKPVFHEPVSEKYVTEKTVTSESPTVASYFASKGFALWVDTKKANVAPVEPLAFLLAINHNSCKFFLKYVRENICKKNFHINYCVAKIPGDAKNAIVGLAEKFGEYGIISNLYYNRATEVITGTLSSAGRVVNFLNGDYLEFFGRAVAQKVIKESAAKYGTDYEIYGNVNISKDNEKHELDMVFRVGGHIFWSEIKSGKFFDFDTYRKLGCKIGLNPDRHILLSAETKDEATDVISWFYEFYVANITSFKDKLTDMIDNAFKGGMNNE